jgi:hypothetical protein
MSGVSEQLDFDREIFNLCVDRPFRKLFVEAWVVIRQDEISDKPDVRIDEIDHLSVQLGFWEDEESLKTELFEVVLDSTLTPGCYLLQGLFDVKRDGDGYQYWYYLEENIVEFQFMCTIEEHEKPVTIFESINSNIDFL